MPPQITVPAHPLATLAQALRQQARAHRHRRLLVISGESRWCRDQAVSLVGALNAAAQLWVGRDAPPAIDSLQNNRALERLGGELDLLIYDAYSGFDPDAFGALSGTLRGGGLLLLLTPQLDLWHRYDDPAHQRIAVAGYPAAAVGGEFLSRLARIVQSDPAATLVTETSPPQTLQIPAETPSADASDFGDCLTLDQHQAVEEILHRAKGHRRRPLVLSADRGRGKSSALGIAAARLIQAGHARILVTAPRRSATHSLFERAMALLPAAASGADGLTLNGCALRYSAPDHLLAEPQPADLLLVDEAAAIPTPLLAALLERYPRVVFATTLHGYEGTGLGFHLRFKRHLDQVTPQWRELRLKTPIRWASDDPLEPLVFRLLALDAAPAPERQVQDATPASVSLEAPERRALQRQESDLGQIFGLLVLAHYRTTPLDFRLLLDAPNLQTLLLRQAGAVAGVALLAAEGGFDQQLSEQIWAGRRRPRGHLMAQSLAAHVGVVDAPRLKGLRIMRIAIHPSVQRRGLGSRLIGDIRRHARDRGFDYIGTSFGADPALIGFWHRNGLHPVRLGLHAGASSGGYPVMLIEPLTAAGRRMADDARKRFSQALPALLSDPLRALPAALAGQLLALSDLAATITISPPEWRELAGFAFASRGYETSLPAILKLSLRGLGSARLAPDDNDLLVMRVVQKRDWSDCAKLCRLSGRRGVEARLRGILGTLFRHFADPENQRLADILTDSGRGQIQ